MSLERIGTDIWLVEGGIVDFYGFPYSTRGVLIRLPDGGLWFWSPVEPTDELRAEIDALGPLAHLVSPNKLHHLWLGAWQQAYPKAKLWGPASTLAKRKDLAFDSTLRDTPPDDWSGTIDQWDVRLWPVFEEIVFLHRPSRTAILADTSEAFSADFLERHWPAWKRRIARLWGITEGVGHAPLELRLLTWRRGPVRARIQDLIDRQPECVVMAHGVWQRGDGAAYLAKAFDWLGVQNGQARQES